MASFLPEFFRNFLQIINVSLMCEIEVIALYRLKFKNVLPIFLMTSLDTPVWYNCEVNFQKYFYKLKT